MQPCRHCIPVPALGLAWRHCGGPTPSPPPCPAPAHGSHHTHTPASPKSTKKVDFCRHPLLRNRTVIPGIVPKCVSPTGETCIRPPARVHSHGEHQVSPSHLWCFRGANTLCYIPSLFSRKRAYINNKKSGEGRSVHFLITCETTAAPKEQRDGRG